MASYPVRESIRQVDDNTWLIGNHLLLSHTTTLTNCTWQDGNRGGYTITNAPDPLPESHLLSDTSPKIRLIYEAGDVSAVFTIGPDVFCKVRVLDIPDVTREHVTLEWLHQRRWSFAIPNVLYHAEHDGRYYIILSKVPGETADRVWPTLDEDKRQYYAEKVVDICTELAVPVESSNHNNNNISGVDGGVLSELYLCGREIDCCSRNLRKSCLELGMDCSNLVFYHCDLGPTNVLIDLLPNPSASSTGKSLGLCLQSGPGPEFVFLVG